MRSFIAISPRTPIHIAALLTVVACHDYPLEPPDYQPCVGTQAQLAGTYEGTVQGPGGLVSQVGEAVLTVNQAGDSISGDLILDAQFTEGPNTISVAFQSTYTGVVTQGAYPEVVLLLKNPVCGGNTEFRGMYTVDNASLKLVGEYVLRDANGCSPITTLDLAVSVQRAPE